jgi:hypothetical protein
MISFFGSPHLRHAHSLPNDAQLIYFILQDGGDESTPSVNQLFAAPPVDMTVD